MSSALSPRQERFALALADGLSQRQAYIAAGYSRKGKPHTLDAAACKLAATPRVKARLGELTAALTASVEWNREKAATELLEQLTIARGKLRAAKLPDDAGLVPADVPHAASKLGLGAIDRLNDLYGLKDKSPEEGVTIIIDLP